MNALHPFDEAYRLVLERAAPVDPELIPLPFAAGRLLALPIRADRDLPPFHRSERDGYAVRSADFRDGRALLTVAGTIHAGDTFGGVLGQGECVKIMTGAALPEGADAVVMVEKSLETAEGVELSEENIAPGLYVHARGVDAQPGETIVPAGEPLSPSQIAVAAAVGMEEVPVYRAVSVGMIATGSEIVPFAADPGPLQIRESNGLALRAICDSLPYVEVVSHWLVSDDSGAIVAAFEKLLAISDVIVLAGGVSMGEKDIVPETLIECGVKEVLHDVAIRPGKPFWMGSAAGEKLVFALPGNPVSFQVTFRELVLPAIKKMAGFIDPTHPELRLPLGAPLNKTLPLRQFLMARLEEREGGVRVVPIPHHGSGDFVSASKADGLLVLPEGELALDEDEKVLFHPWRLP